MDKTILGNFIIYFPTAAYVLYTIMAKEPNTGIDWTQVVLAAGIAILSSMLGKYIKNKGEVE